MLGVDHIPEVERNAFGTPLLDSIFQLAESRAASDLLGYVNADLILLADFLSSVSQASDGSPRFLMVGRTIDVDVTEELAWDDENADHELRELVDRAGTVHPPKRSTTSSSRATRSALSLRSPSDDPGGTTG